ncbi:MAG: hypothetical protein U0271_10060 [Polyangiaceae bacterium]
MSPRACCRSTISPSPIKQIERVIADHITSAELAPAPASSRRAANGKRVAIVRLRPGGPRVHLQGLARRGRAVTVYEKADRPGGLLRYGIPDFKMEKALIDRRLEQLRGEGVRFVCRRRGRQGRARRGLLAEFDAIGLAVGAEAPRRLGVPIEDLPGVRPAMGTSRSRTAWSQGTGSRGRSHRRRRALTS